MVPQALLGKQPFSESPIVVSPSRVRHSGVRGLSAVRHALRPQQLEAPNLVESRKTVALTVGLVILGRR